MATKPKRSSQGPLTLWHGMTLSEMVKLMSRGPDLHWSRWSRLALMPPMGLYNSVMGGIENLVYGRKIAKTTIEKPPLFVLGFWRSGTTLLHNLLCDDPRFVYPTLYQTVFPHHFLLSERIATKMTSWLVPESRPMDNVKVNWSTPQEDDVALCILSLLSPYTLLAFPSDLEDAKRSLFLDALPPREKQSWMNALMLLLKKITLQHDGKRVVLKSPSHTFRVKVLLEMFPDAKFVYIYRNPFDVFNSTCHLRRTMIEENTLGKAKYDGMEEDILQIYQAGFEAYERDRQFIPQGNLHEVKYEDLAANPLEEMEKVYEGLQLGEFETLKQIIEPQVPQIKRYKKNRFVPDEYWMKRVTTEWEDAFARFDYPPELKTSESADQVAA